MIIAKLPPNEHLCLRLRLEKKSSHTMTLRTLACLCKQLYKANHDRVHDVEAVGWYEEGASERGQVSGFAFDLGTACAGTGRGALCRVCLKHFVVVQTRGLVHNRVYLLHD